MPYGRVYQATQGECKYVVKGIPQYFSARLRMYELVASWPHIRGLSDVIPERRTFVFPYLDEHLLRAAQHDLPKDSTKEILRCALKGLARLHERDIVHNDTKPNNIFMNTTALGSVLQDEQVQISDLQDSAYAPPGSAVKGAQLGNWTWPSREAHACGPVEKPSDMFAFDIVCIYAMTQKVIYAVDESELPEAIEKLAVVLENQISIFADGPGIEAFLDYIGHERFWHEVFTVIKQGFGKDQPRQPSPLWQGLDNEAYRDVVCGLTNFDPTKQLTAQQALSHECFRA